MKDTKWLDLLIYLFIPLFPILLLLITLSGLLVVIIGVVALIVFASIGSLVCIWEDTSCYFKRKKNETKRKKEIN